MSRGYKILISVLAIIFSILSSSIGAGLAGGSGLEFPQKFLFNFVFMMQFTTTVWCVFAIFRKTKEK